MIIDSFLSRSKCDTTNNNVKEKTMIRIELKMSLNYFPNFYSYLYRKCLEK